jgi:hypothetical protein
VYTARIESEGHLIKLTEFSVAPRETARPEITLLRRPRRSLVSVTARAIVIRRQINFATDSDEILEQSFGLMEEIADVIMRNPQLTSIEIQGHTDDRGGREHNQDLSQRRADSVRAWLTPARRGGQPAPGHGLWADPAAGPQHHVREPRAQPPRPVRGAVTARAAGCVSPHGWPA